MLTEPGRKKDPIAYSKSNKKMKLKEIRAQVQLVLIYFIIPHQRNYQSVNIRSRVATSFFEFNGFNRFGAPLG